MSLTPSDPATPAIPRHIAVILDGNGRWACARGLPRVAGHRKGAERVREIVRACRESGVEYLTLFAFSSENWSRPAREVKALLDLFLGALNREVDKLHARQVRFRVIGDLERFGDEIKTAVRMGEELTRANRAMTLTIAANYGGRWDVAQACAEIARRVVRGEIDPAMITPETVASFLSTHELPDPDLFIRTGGEQRMSNFLLWQLAYTEFYFTPVLWPDFDHAEFANAVAVYGARERRFGLTGEQIGAVRNA